VQKATTYFFSSFPSRHFGLILAMRLKRPSPNRHKRRKERESFPHTCLRSPPILPSPPLLVSSILKRSVRQSPSSIADDNDDGGRVGTNETKMDRGATSAQKQGTRRRQETLNVGFGIRAFISKTWRKKCHYTASPSTTTRNCPASDDIPPLHPPKFRFVT